MSDSTSNKTRRQSAEDEIELRPDGWRQFERAVDAAVKSGPKHKGKVTTRRKPSRKKR